MSNDITKILNIEDDGLVTKLVNESDMTLTFEIERPLSEHFCPSCGFRMHSLGIRQRTVNHPVLQDGRRVVLLLNVRRWRCQNPECGVITSDKFSFVETRKRNTNLTDFMIVNALRDPNSTAASVAERFHVSDTYVLETFARFVDMKRYPLSEIISVDEVYIRLSEDCRYALVIQDFVSGELIDLLPERRDRVTEPYFISIPFEERKKVKYVIADMYMPYLKYPEKYFPNAVPVVDSFHVVKWIYHEITNYLRKLLSKYKARDEEKRERISAEKHRNVKLPLSDEVYLLQNHRWVMLRNQENIDYTRPMHMDRHYHCFMDTYSYEKEFFRMDPHLETIRDLKEKYIHFNHRYAGNPDAAGPELDSLIRFYEDCSYEMFHTFASLLKRYRDYILNSFVLVKRTHCTREQMSRLSNGPMESLNRVPKDIRRSTRGFVNRDLARNRIMFAIRKDAPILAVPKSREEVAHITGKKRGKYRK